jgi:hypothetical protein
MNETNYRWVPILAVSLAGFVSGCHKASDFSVSSVTDSPVIHSIRLGDLAQFTEGYGISIGSGPSQEFEVNIEAKRSHEVKVGQMAEVRSIAASEAIRCQVTRVLRNVSQETNQALAWLKPLRETDIPAGEFIFTQIKSDLKKRVLVVPKTAVLVRDSGTWVIKADPSKKYVAVPIQLGIESGDHVEVTAGVKEADLIVQQGGIGFLSPSFSQKGSSD